MSSKVSNNAAEMSSTKQDYQNIDYSDDTRGKANCFVYFNVCFQLDLPLFPTLNDALINSTICPGPSDFLKPYVVPRMNFSRSFKRSS